MEKGPFKLVVITSLSIMAIVVTCAVLYQKKKNAEKAAQARRKKKMASNVNIGGVFGMDVGGTLTKIVYFEAKTNAATVNKTKSDSDMSSSAPISTPGTGTGSNVIANSAVGPPSLVKRQSSSDSLAQLESPDHQEALRKLYTYMDQNYSAATSQRAVRDEALSFYSPFLEGRLHFLYFETRNMMESIRTVASTALVEHIRTIGCTGGGAHKFAGDFEEQLDITINKFDELECLVRGMHFALNNFPGECFTYRQAVTPSSSKSSSWSSISRSMSNLNNTGTSIPNSSDISPRSSASSSDHNSSSNNNNSSSSSSSTARVTLSKDSTKNSSYEMLSVIQEEGHNTGNTSSNCGDGDDAGADDFFQSDAADEVTAKQQQVPIEPPQSQQQPQQQQPQQQQQQSQQTYSQPPPPAKKAANKDKDYTQRVVLPYDSEFLSAFPYLVVNIGSGVSILKVTGPGQAERVSGTSLGGGTYWGLCRLLTSCTTYEEVLSFAEQGDANVVDMLVRDIYGGDYTLSLSGSTVASSFGKLVTKENPREGVREEDLALALLMMITNNIGQVAYLTAQLQKCSKIFFVGSFLRHNLISCRRLSYAINFWSNDTMEALFLVHEGYFGALGTFLSSAFASDVNKIINMANLADISSSRRSSKSQSNGKFSGHDDTTAMDSDADTDADVDGNAGGVSKGAQAHDATASSASMMDIDITKTSSLSTSTVPKGDSKSVETQTTAAAAAVAAGGAFADKKPEQQQQHHHHHHHHRNHHHHHSTGSRHSPSQQQRPPPEPLQYIDAASLSGTYSTGTGAAAGAAAAGTAATSSALRGRSFSDDAVSRAERLRRELQQQQQQQQQQQTTGEMPSTLSTNFTSGGRK